MVDDELLDGSRIAALLSSEVHGHERGALGSLVVADADPDVEPADRGTFAYAIDQPTAGGSGNRRDADDESRTGADDDRTTERLAAVYVHPDRVHVEFRVGVDTAVEAAHAEGLRVRPKAVEPPRTLVFVENGAEVKRALRVVRAVAAERLEDAR